MNLYNPPKVQKQTTREKHIEQEELPDFPNELKVLPYQLGELQAFIFGRMTYPSDSLAGFIALATLGAFAQTNFSIKSRDGMGFAEFYQLWAPTGFGKEDMRKPVEILNRMAESKNEGVKLHYNAPASAQAMHSLLSINRSAYFLSDEFAEWLRATRSDGHKQQALGYAMQAYSKQLSTIEVGHAMSNDYTPVQSPRLSILATSTAAAMVNVMTRDHAESGAYNRWVIMAGDEQLPEKRYTGMVYEPSNSVVDFIKWVKDQPETQVSFSQEGFQKYIELDQSMAEPIKAKDAVMGGRLGEQAIRMAALIALSDKRTSMTASDLEYGFKIRLGLYQRARALLERDGNLSGGHKTNKAFEQIAKALERRGAIYKSAFPTTSRAYEDLTVTEQSAVIKALIDRGIANDHGKSLSYIKEPCS